MHFWYKIIETNKQGMLKTLFHGVNGSRLLEIDKWLKAELKFVKDGTGGTIYLSGWNIVPTKKECEEYLKLFKHQQNKRILKCRAKNIWPKSHSRSNIYLAEYLFIEKE